MNDDMILRAEEKAINWYPGHMARARRCLAEQLGRAEAVLAREDEELKR